MRVQPSKEEEELPDTPPDQVESPRPVILWIIPLLLATITPGLRWATGAALMTIRVDLGVAMSLGVGIVAIGLLAILSKGFTRRIRWALGVTAVAIVALFQWPVLTNAGIEVAAVLRIPFLSDAIPVVLAVTFLWLAARLAGEVLFAVLFGFGMLAIVAALTIAGLPALADSPEPTAPMAAVPGSPDVILLILDGYAGDDILQQTFGFDNTSFNKGLEDLGFEVAYEARTNYSFTYAAVSTMLNLDYVFDVGELSESELAAMRQALSGDPALYRTFHEAGYEVAFAENAWSGSYCGPTADICWRDGLMERAFWNLGRMTILAPLLSSTRPHPFNTVSFDNLRRLPEIVGQGRTEGVPRLTVVHVILPHPPLLLDSHCNRQPDPDRRPLRVTDPEVLETRRGYYIDQLICTNTTTLRSLQAIIEERSDIIVMVTADHGSELPRAEDVPVSEWTDRELASRMMILGAYRLPGCEGLVYPTITPVNGVRLTVNCALGTTLDLLPDRNYWTPSGLSGEVSDVGFRLDD